MKRETRAAAVFVLLLAGLPVRSLAAPAAAAPAAAAPVAELDVVVDTNLRVTPEYRQAYLETMLELARGCLGGLVLPQKRDPAAPASDGAARYRLFIRHQGTVEVEQTASPAQTVGPGPGSILKLTARQKGKFIFRLAQWSGSAYPALDTWSSEFEAAHVLPVPRDATAEDMVFLRNEALLTAMPDAVSRGILDRILPIRLTGTSGEPGKPKAYTVTVENRSRWALRKLAVEVIWCEQAGMKRYRYCAEPRYDGWLAPGKKAELKGTAPLAPSLLAWDYTLPVQITARPTFVPGGPGAAERP
ncbi:MAG: hypothetical protein AMS14_09530 [Planctomycetes bacterium DG_20]|nr:MAG: hypothetical protein AMS14_09530 [Planctomycetes bacterium DG_20]